tara:strand:+ start:59 stop:517 length:459 start_codon:yes stop_codon:yes gene_type:complete
MKIENEELWQKIKAGELKGLSIEGYFTNKFEQMQKKEFTTEEVRTALKELLSVQKVELGLIDDALKFRKGVKVFGKNIDISEEELEKTYRSVRVDLEELEGDLNALKKGMKAIETSAKELGLKANSIPEYKDAIDVVSYGEKQIQKGKKLLK